MWRKDSAVSCIERGSERSGENQKERLQYLAAGTEGTATEQGAGYGALKTRTDRIVFSPVLSILTFVLSL